MTPVREAIKTLTQDGLLHVLGQAPGGEDPDTFRGMLLGGGAGLIGKLLVVEVVQQTDHAPCIGILALPLGHGAHGKLDGIHVAPQRLGGGVLMHELEGVRAAERHASEK